MRERDIMYLSELIENRIISYCIKEEGSLQEHLNIGEELAHRAMIQNRGRKAPLRDGDTCT